MLICFMKTRIATNEKPFLAFWMLEAHQMNQTVASFPFWKLEMVYFLPKSKLFYKYLWNKWFQDEITYDPIATYKLKSKFKKFQNFNIP